MSNEAFKIVSNINMFIIHIQDALTLLFSLFRTVQTYGMPGIYLEELPCPARRQYSTIFVEMSNEIGQVCEGDAVLSIRSVSDS